MIIDGLELGWPINIIYSVKKYDDKHGFHLDKLKKLETEDLEDAILEVMTILSEKERTILLCYYKDGFTQNDIANIYNTSQNTVSFIINNSTEKMRASTESKWVHLGLKGMIAAKEDDLARIEDIKEKLRNGNPIISEAEMELLEIKNLGLTTRTRNALLHRGINYITNIRDVKHLNSIFAPSSVAMKEVTNAAYKFGINLYSEDTKREKGEIIMSAKTISIKKLTATATIPTSGSEYAVGYDLYADLKTEEVHIPPHHTEMISTGLAMEIPVNFGGFIFARSGLASKQGLRPANCVGVIDPDYRGEIKVALHNDTDKERVVKNKERIAQIAFIPFQSVCFEVADELSDTVRGNGGFGSTGKN